MANESVEQQHAETVHQAIEECYIGSSWQEVKLEHWITSKLAAAEEALSGARHIAEILARDERAKTDAAESADVVYAKPLNSGQREGLRHALSSLLRTASDNVERVREAPAARMDR